MGITRATGRVASNSLTSLAQLAVDSGGRYTERTNDFTLAYARAQRDLACVYSLGLYIDPKEDHPQGITVRVLRPGMRTIHPSRFVLRSDGKKKESLLRAAWVSPEMFQSGVVRAHLFPLRPTSKDSWDGLLAIAFPVPLDARGGEAVQRDFGAVITRSLSVGGEKVMHRFNRRFTLQPHRSDVTSEPTITFLQEVELEPGEYEITAVLTDPDDVMPHASTMEIEVPEIPRRDLFLIGPMLGRRSGPNLVVHGGGDVPGSDEFGEKSSFEPLLLHQLDEADDLVAVTQVCLVGAKNYRSSKGRVATIDRSLSRLGGVEVGTLKTERVELTGKAKLKCQQLVDVLPAASLNSGEYVFEVLLHDGQGEELRRKIRFAVGK